MAGRWGLPDCLNECPVSMIDVSAFVCGVALCRCAESCVRNADALILCACRVVPAILARATARALAAARAIAIPTGETPFNSD